MGWLSVIILVMCLIVQLRCILVPQELAATSYADLKRIPLGPAPHSFSCVCYTFCRSEAVRSTPEGCQFLFHPCVCGQETTKSFLLPCKKAKNIVALLRRKERRRRMRMFHLNLGNCANSTLTQSKLCKMAMACALLYGLLRIRSLLASS